jgi:hypothetical protein
MAIDVPVEKVFNNASFRTDQLVNYIDNQFSYKSKNSSTIVWQNIKATRNKPELLFPIYQDNELIINNNITLKIPTAFKQLESILLEGKYILELNDDWDEEGSVGYTIESWKAAAQFIINFNKWLKGVFLEVFYLPKMSHGPKGTIDVIWHEDNFRLFVNIDYANNKGTFYSDTQQKQFSEGEFLLNDFKFQMLPMPFKS